MQLKESEFYAFYGTYEYLITEMDIKLLDAKFKLPNGNFLDAEHKIKSLEKLRDLFHSMYHEQIKNQNNDGKVLFERAKLLKYISKLEMENKNLKENIKL